MSLKSSPFNPPRSRLHAACARLRQRMLGALAMLLLAFASPSAMSAGFAVDTSGTAMTGLWWNQNESGWGTAITHQYGMFFVTIYTYDSSKKPVWYFASSCPVSANGCSGTLYSAKGGAPLSSAWSGAGLSVTPAGTVNLAFTDTNTGTMTFTINGVNGAKAITRQIFASGTTPATADYSGIWWNPNESGWGMALQRQKDMNFATIYTYDASGNPTWYVASSCPVVATGCTGSLYSITGGSPLTSAWSGSSLNVAPVGSLTLAFTDANTGAMSYTLNGVNGSRNIARQVFASAPVASSGSCNTSTAPVGMNYSQSGNTITVSTNGCIAMPAASMCTPSSPQATGINVLVSNTTTAASLSGITFNVPGMPNPFESMAAAYASTKTCIRNAPADYGSLRINYNVCYDITSQMAASLSTLQASGMVSVKPPITVATQGSSTMKVVADCTASGADAITDAVTGQIWIKQSDGSYLAI